MCAGLLAYSCSGLPLGDEMAIAAPAAAAAAAAGAQAPAAAIETHNTGTGSHVRLAERQQHFHAVLSLLSVPPSSYAASLAVSPSTLVLGACAA